MKDIMLDLETMDTRPEAAIVSIGAVYFDLATKELGEEFYCAVDLESACRNGGTLSTSTILWWLQQSNDARRALAESPINIIEALGLFQEFCNLTGGNVRMWGNGSDFDNVVLASAFRNCGKKQPWSFRNNRCYRTIKASFVGAPLPELKRVGTHHNALDDAVYQARHLIQMIGGKDYE